MVKSKRTGEDIITVPPITNAVLTTVFLAEVVGIFGMLLFRPGMTTSVGAPLVGAEAAAALAAACVVLFPTIQLVKLASEAVGGLLSRSLLKPLGDPLRKSKNMAKFKDQMWQLAIHVSMTLLEVWILYYDGGGEPWLDEYWSFWIPCAAQRRRAICRAIRVRNFLSAASVHPRLQVPGAAEEQAVGAPAVPAADGDLDRHVLLPPIRRGTAQGLRDDVRLSTAPPEPTRLSTAPRRTAPHTTRRQVHTHVTVHLI